MPFVHLAADTDPDEVAVVIASDGAVIVDGVAPPALLGRIESELRPYLAATPTGPEIQRQSHPEDGLADRPVARVSRARHAPPRARHRRAPSSNTPRTSSYT